MLDPRHCRVRQRRLLDLLPSLNLDAVVFMHPRHVHYLSGHRTFWLHQSAFVLQADGRSHLVTANEPNAAAAADEVSTYEANWLGTQRTEQPDLIAEAVRGLLVQNRLRHVGLDASVASSALAIRYDEKFGSIEPTLWRLRRKKDPDELALLKKAIACAAAMHRRAREIVEPGVEELFVYSQLHQAAVETAGEPLSDLLGNDYACCAPGGPPRGGRALAAGELYILDIGPAYRGYFADTSRTFAVDRKPTDAQLKAWEIVSDSFPIIERMARPGVRCRDLFAAVDEHYRLRTGAGFPHHLGHGIGLQPHEWPHLNPKWDDTLLEGEVFTVEPGLYAPELRAGIRLENNYLVTADSVTNLYNEPLELS